MKVHGCIVDDPLAESRGLVEIAVADDGPGIDLPLLDRVFEPAFSTKASAKKMGFGLWWTRSLIQRFGGSIRVENNPDGGCTFTVQLPLLEGTP